MDKKNREERKNNNKEEKRRLTRKRFILRNCPEEKEREESLRKKKKEEKIIETVFLSKFREGEEGESNQFGKGEEKRVEDKIFHLCHKICCRQGISGPGFLILHSKETWQL